jgi:signal transduction histidine kinase
MQTATASNMSGFETVEPVVIDAIRPAPEDGRAAELALDDLREMMRSVDETARALQATHANLHNEVVRLQEELADAHAKLQRSRELAALGEMAAGIAHEIRNPLGSIQLYVQCLADDLDDRPKQAAMCRKINHAVVGLDRIVRDVLAFSRDMHLRVDEVEAQQLMRQALIDCQAVLQVHEVQVRWPAEPTEPVCFRGDAGLLVQALGNIIRNAAEAMQESTNPAHELHVGISSRMMRCPDGERRLRTGLSVRDTGPGIPAEVIDRMFNPFFTTRQAGTGLGLAIVHRIVDAHGGHLNVNSQPGRGAEIELCLPAQPPVRPVRQSALPQTREEAQHLAHTIRNQVVRKEAS